MTRSFGAAVRALGSIAGLKRALVESFIVMEPYWTVATGSVPFWMVFNTLPSADALERYLARADPYDEILAMLFSHGVESAGVAPIERWKRLVARARRTGELVGVDEDAYPRDFAVFARYHRDLHDRVAPRHPLPPPEPLVSLDEALHAAGDRVELIG